MTIILHRLIEILRVRNSIFKTFLFPVYLRAVGGEVGATSALAPKIGPLGLVSRQNFHIRGNLIIYAQLVILGGTSYLGTYLQQLYETLY